MPGLKSQACCPAAGPAAGCSAAPESVMLLQKSALNFVENTFVILMQGGGGAEARVVIEKQRKQSSAQLVGRRCWRLLASDATFILATGASGSSSCCKVQGCQNVQHHDQVFLIITLYPSL